jgi:cytochrome c
MQSPLPHQRILVGLLIVALAQLACSLGSAPAGSSPQPGSSGGPQATQPGAPAASERGTPEQAMAMLKQAVAHYNTVGRTQALADFNGRVAPFFDRDLYVACIDSSLKISANGGFPNLVGSSTEPLSRARWDSASTTKVDSLNYAYTDPATNKTEPKTLYYEKVGSDVCGVGAYHP